MCVCVCVCMYVCMYVYIFISICVCVCTIHVLFNFGLNLCKKFFPLFEVGCSRGFDLVAAF